MNHPLKRLWDWIVSLFKKKERKPKRVPQGDGTVNDLYFELSKIHDRIHRGFKYQHDIVTFGIDEHWGYPVDVDNLVDDCDGFAIACRMLIRKMDPDLETRLIACQTETGEWHAVCAVGNYILENRYFRVMLKEELLTEGYIFHYASGLNPGDPWLKLEESNQ